jgi:hypothetical protein
LYGLPIWITEFNANPYRSTAVQLGFMELALPYLETLDYVERYNWFQPNPTPLDPNDNVTNVGTGEFYTTRPPGLAIITDVGLTYKNQVSTPSVLGITLNASNNLNLEDFPNIALNKTAVASSAYSTNIPSGAVSGDAALSLWQANFGVSANSNFALLPAWFEVDLQGSFTINGIRIVELTKALKDFKFQVWDPTLAMGLGGWSDVITVTGNPATPLTTYKTFTPITATKVRLYISAHNSLDYIKLSELEVYGVVSSTLGNPKFEKQAFAIYPNPIKNGVLNITGNEEIQYVDVYSILGNKINILFVNNELQISDLASGVYFLRVNNKYSFKFIKN